jgi:thioredoxin-like negative regulator of GroEL
MYSQRLAPVLEELVRQYMGRVKFARMDTTANNLVPSQYEITGTPTLILFKNGRLVNRINGLQPKEVIQRYLDYLARLS